MQDPHRRRGYRHQLLRAMLGMVGIVVLATLAYFLIRGAVGMYGKFTQAAAAREAGEARLTGLMREEEHAKERVAQMGTARGLEAEVRERYGLARPGEGEIVVVRPKDEAVGAVPERGLWERLWGALFPW